VIPMDKWDPDKSVFDFMVINDDMVAYTNMISKFTSSEVANFTTISDAVQAYANVLYKKARVNIFFIEIILRALMIKEPEYDFGVPIVKDPNDVSFGTLYKVISGRSVAVKFGFESMNKYLMDPDTYTIKKESGIYDIFFGGL
jgi:hypothetical protein